jgi:SsrA-binding protein
MARQAGEKLIVDNRRARHDYELSDRVEAGLVLTGTEVKSLRAGQATLQQAYGEVRGGEAWLVGLHVPEYTEGNRANHDPDRPRKLLLHRREIERLASRVAERGFTIVPTRLYFKDGRVKCELALARGKERRDRRRDIAADRARAEEPAALGGLLAAVEPDRPRLDALEQQMRVRPRVEGPDRLDLVLGGGLHRVRDPAVRKRAAEDDLALLDERVHVGGVLGPERLLLEREPRVEVGPGLAQDDVEHRHGYNSYTTYGGDLASTWSIHPDELQAEVAGWPRKSTGTTQVRRTISHSPPRET